MIRTCPDRVDHLMITAKARAKRSGWEVIDEFLFDEKNYFTFAFDMGRSVLK